MKLRSLYFGNVQIANDFIECVRETQKDDQFLQEKILLASENGEADFVKDATGMIRFKGRMCILQSSEL